MVSGPLCLVEELWCALPRHPILSGRWDIEAMWSRSGGGGAAAVGAGGSRLLMVADGPGELDLPKSHEEACVEWAARVVESGPRT